MDKKNTVVGEQLATPDKRHTICAETLTGLDKDGGRSAARVGLRRQRNPATPGHAGRRECSNSYSTSSPYQTWETTRLHWKSVGHLSFSPVESSPRKTRSTFWTFGSAARLRLAHKRRRQRGRQADSALPPLNSTAAYRRERAHALSRGSSAMKSKDAKHVGFHEDPALSRSIKIKARRCTSFHFVGGAACACADG